MMKVHGGMESWPYDYKQMKHEAEIMLIDKELSDQGKDINIGFCFCWSKMSREVIDQF